MPPDFYQAPVLTERVALSSLSKKKIRGRWRLSGHNWRLGRIHHDRQDGRVGLWLGDVDN